MMTADATAPSSTADREIVLSRELDAPRELVWRAYTEPAHVAVWWGPNGFTNTVHEHDVRVGGRWRFIMHGPDGRDYPNRIVYQEIVEPQRLVFLHGEDVDDDPGAFHVTVTFDDLGGRTRVTQKMVFATAAQRAGVEQFGAVELGNQTLAKLAAYLRTM
ncbi:MAG TPA: SRPBCC family protein [Longimicrobium sp.]